MESQPDKILSPLQQEALREFGQTREAGQFVLAGASALSGFYLGHRRSGDLDLFTPHEPLIDIRGGFPLEELIRLAPKKDTGFDPYWMGRALERVKSMPEDPARWPVEMLVAFDVAALKRRFSEAAQRLLRGGLE